MKEALKALKQSFKDCGSWYEGPGYIGTSHLVIGGEQAELEVMKIQANLHTKPETKRNISAIEQEALDNTIKKAQKNINILEEPGLIYGDKKGNTLRVLFGNSIGVVFVNDKYIPDGTIGDAYAASSKDPLYIVPCGKMGLGDPHWMVVASCSLVDEKLVTYFEPLAKEIVKNL
jgi:hypothetical protein